MVLGLCEQFIIIKNKYVYMDRIHDDILHVDVAEHCCKFFSVAADHEDTAEMTDHDDDDHSTTGSSASSGEDDGESMMECDTEYEQLIGELDFLEQVEAAFFQLQDKFLFEKRIYVSEDVGVYRAVDKQTGDTVCLKFKRHSDTHSKEKPLDVHTTPFHEAIMLRHLQKVAGVQSFRGLYLSHAMLVLVTDFYLDGTVSDVLHFALSLCQAVQELHQRGVIHRDIKHSNVIYNGGDVTLIDFDLSITTGAAAMASTDQVTVDNSLGTDGFMAPELYSDQRLHHRRRHVRSGMHGGCVHYGAFGSRPKRRSRRILCKGVQGRHRPGGAVRVHVAQRPGPAPHCRGGRAIPAGAIKKTK